MKRVSPKDWFSDRIMRKIKGYRADAAHAERILRIEGAGNKSAGSTGRASAHRGRIPSKTYPR